MELEITKSDITTVEAQERASTDIQIETAKKYPRNESRAEEKSIQTVTRSVEFASKCNFAKPVGKDVIYGPSVHLARVIAQQWGNLRIRKQIKEITNTSIIAECIVHDLETNFAVCSEARRSILDKNGEKFKSHLIETNAMAVLAIAERNAILQIIPKGVVDATYKASKEKANGVLSDKNAFAAAKQNCIDLFKKLGATEDEICELLEIGSTTAMTVSDVDKMRGYKQALQDRDITFDELFNRSEKKKEKANKKVVDVSAAETVPFEEAENPKEVDKKPHQPPKVDNGTGEVKMEF